MALQPIDLQTLFTQMDKVGKGQISQREGQQIQAAMQQIQIQRKQEENVQSVNETQEMGKEAEKIKDDKGHGSYAEQGRGKEQAEEEGDSAEEAVEPELIRDPALGRNIDISG